MFWRKLVALFRRTRFERELEEEMQLHRELRARQMAEQYVEKAEARTDKAFGNVTRVRELSREAWRWRRLEDLAQDLRYAARLLRKSPLFAITGSKTPCALGDDNRAQRAAKRPVRSAQLLVPLHCPDTLMELASVPLPRLQTANTYSRGCGAKRNDADPPGL